MGTSDTDVVQLLDQEFGVVEVDDRKCEICGVSVNYSVSKYTPLLTPPTVAPSKDWACHVRKVGYSAGNQSEAWYVRIVCYVFLRGL